MTDYNYKLTVKSNRAIELFDLLKEINAGHLYIGHNSLVTSYACRLTSEDLLSITLKFADVIVAKV